MKYVICILIFYSFYSCNTGRNDTFKIIVKCSIPSESTLEILEKDIDFVDWENQFFYLKEGILNKLNFNTKVCYEGCSLYILLGEKEIYSAVIHCDIAPTSLDLEGENVLYIRPKEKALNLFYKNRLQLNVNKGRILSKDKAVQKQLCSFMYVTELKEYLKTKHLLKEQKKE